jgi:hypothetical protein
MFKVYFEKYRISVGIAIIVLIGLYIIKDNTDTEEDFKVEMNNPVFSIAKVKRNGKYYTDYIYYFDKVKYKGSFRYGNRYLVGRYFIVELSKKDPGLSRIRLDKEIKDSARIANSGFRKKTLDEILEMK